VFPFNGLRNAGYVKWNLGVSVGINQHLEVYGRIENLLDDRYEEANGFPALGRTLWAGATARF